MRLLRKILWCINYGDKRKSYETLCQQSYEIASLDCNSDEAVERLERWKRAVAGLLRDNKELAERFGRLSFMPTAGVLTDVDTSFEWNDEDWNTARGILSKFALANGGSRQK